mgnify:FL=1
MNFVLHQFLVVALAIVLDAILGDPEFVPHPVVFMGKLVAFLEKKIRSRLPKTSRAEKIGGGILWLIVAVFSALFSFAILFLLQKISVIASFVLELVWAEQCLAAKCLSKEAKNVHTALKQDVKTAQKAVGRIVGRDVEKLDEKGIIRATVETVAENTTDGVIAPLLALFFGGVPAAFFFKAASTMDSMIGYKNERYRHFGMIAARADDFLCFLPARISALLMIFAAFLLRYDYKNALRIFLRDRFNHASPNSAQTESVMAGALGLRLAGNAFYENILEEKPFIGDSLRTEESDDIFRAISLMRWTYMLLAIILSIFFAIALFLLQQK